MTTKMENDACIEFVSEMNDIIDKALQTTNDVDVNKIDITRLSELNEKVKMVTEYLGAKWYTEDDLRILIAKTIKSRRKDKCRLNGWSGRNFDAYCFDLAKNDYYIPAIPTAFLTRRKLEDDQDAARLALSNIISQLNSVRISNN